MIARPHSIILDSEALSALAADGADLRLLLDGTGVRVETI